MKPSNGRTTPGAWASSSTRKPKSQTDTAPSAVQGFHQGGARLRSALRQAGAGRGLTCALASCAQISRHPAQVHRHARRPGIRPLLRHSRHMVARAADIPDDSSTCSSPSSTAARRARASAGRTPPRASSSSHKDSGMVSSVLGRFLGGERPSRVGIGHIRYSTSGGSGARNAQPLVVACNKGAIALAHNGNISNSEACARSSSPRAPSSRPPATPSSSSTS